MYGNHSAIVLASAAVGWHVPISISMDSNSMMQVETASSDAQAVQQQCAAVESALKQAAANPPSRRMV